MKKLLKVSPFVILTFILTFTAADLFATRVLHRNLQELSNLSKRVFVGRCVYVTESFNPGGGLPPYTEYTFEVTESIKGNVGGMITFRQYGLRSPRQISENLAYVGRIPGMPIYQEGQEYVIFLIGDSSLGLTSPVGLFQGAFFVIEENGRKMVINGNNNVGLFKELSAEKMELGLSSNLSQNEKGLMTVKKGPLNYNDFISLVRKMVNGKK